MAIESPQIATNEVIPVSSGDGKSGKLISVVNALVLAGSGIIIGSQGPDVYKTIKDEYALTMDLRNRASELLEAEKILNQLKKYPGASIKFDEKNKSWSVILPPKNDKGRSNKKMETTLQKPNAMEDIERIHTEKSPGSWDSFNQKGIADSNELSTATLISNPEHTGLIRAEDEYNSFIRTLTPQLSMSMPDFTTLKERIGLEEGTEIKLVQHNDEIWVYGNVQENNINQKYRLRIAIVDTKNKTINTTILNNFYYIIEK